MRLDPLCVIPADTPGHEAEPAAGGGTPSPLYGRDRELAALTELLTRARAGQGGALAILGGPGMGKTALLEAAVRQAADFRTLGTRGIRQETALPYAGLHRLLRPMAARTRQLPGPQAAALAPVTGDGESPAGDSFTLCAAVFGLLADAARGGPVLCWIDDAQWLNRVSLEALTFTARRLTTEPVVMLFAARDDREGTLRERCLADIPALSLAALGEDAAHRLLDGPVPGELAGELVELAAGNPLALVELAAALTPAQRGGEAPAPRALPAHSSLRALYRRRYLRLPTGARRLVMMAVADERLDMDTLARAAALAGIDLAELDAARAAGLMHVDGEAVGVPDPLIRSCLYADAPPAERRTVHRLLADSLDRQWHRLRRTWHRAAGAEEPDTELADELGEAAAEARAGGDHVAAARAWQRAAVLTPDLELKASRFIEAATDHWMSGRTRRAAALLRQVRPFTGTGELRGHADLLQGEIELRDGVPATAAQILTDTAERLAGSHPAKAVRALKLAAEAAYLTGDNQSRVGLADRAETLRDAVRTPADELLIDMLGGMADTYRGRHVEAKENLHRVVKLADSIDGCAIRVWGSVAALALGDVQSSHDLAVKGVTEARAQGAKSLVPWALESLARAEMCLGRFSSATANSTEGLRLARATGQENVALEHLALLGLLAATQGDRETAMSHLEDLAEPLRTRGMAKAGATVSWALACLDLADDRPAEAAARLRLMAFTGPAHTTVRVLATPSFVESAVRCDQHERAVRALQIFALWAEGTGSPGWLALVERCRALLADTDDSAGEHFAKALRLHHSGYSAFELARTELLYGCWLRRGRKPRTAREHLRNALQIFQHYGAEKWSERARTELRATGETVEPAGSRTVDELTPHQLQIARLVAEGATNREIAAQLALSPRTIDHHLRNIFARLQIRSRIELARLFH
ncbi:helix-turn-helix transcriptional regulator [Actinomadura craniellae]|uniref:Helix-turn-helix transcriptional regulator n=1 Tax=Actinomadura craniellae TaxID=2231787 RepID=A0A365HDK1_9ACTN|nr:LuxR family transcriptional regulator [Actinomadura craniellae]RAY17185.1 helix-turn-helix transcriptional regulator [Actinomadura craniellae]